MSNPWGDLFPDQPLAVIALETIDAEVARRSQNQTGSWTLSRSSTFLLRRRTQRCRKGGAGAPPFLCAQCHDFT